MTVYDSKLTSFLGQGPAASQPATLNLHPSVFGLYHAKDTGATNLWDGTTWTPLGGGGGTAGVSSFNTRTGAVTLSSKDVTDALTFTPYNATNPAGYQTAAQVTASLGPYALTTSIPVGSSATPQMDGVAAAGSATTFSKGDHIHPTDTSRYAASNPSGYQTAAQVSSAITASAYTLPTASTSVLGGVKVDGTTVTISSGVISAVAGGAGTVTKVSTTGTGISGGPITTAGTLSVQWNGGAVSSLGTGLSLTTGVLDAVAPVGSSATPLMDGVAAAGSGTKLSKDDHVHPTDTSRYAASNPSGYQTAAQVTAALVPYAPIKDPTFTGTAATLPGPPSLDLHATTKQYVDQAVVSVATAGITTLSYNYIANTAAADPGTGNIRFNTAQNYDATFLYIDSRTSDNTDWTNFIKAQVVGTKIAVQLKTDATKICRFLTTGPVVDNSGWLTIPINMAGAGGYQGMPFAGGNNVIVAFLSTANAQFLPIGGGTLTGDLFLPSTTPTVATQATTKKYVDDTAAIETYTLPTASTSVLGGVKVDGTTVVIASGVISAVAGGSGTVTKVSTSGTGISGGPITTAGTLTVAWNAGAVNSLGAGLSLSGGVLNTVAPSAQPYTLGVYAPGVLTNSQVVVTHQVGVAVTFPANFGATATGGSSRSGSLVNATASTTLTVAKCPAASDPTNTANFSAIGTLVFSASGHAATLTTTGGTSQALAAGDFLRVIGPSTADTTLANVFITLIADR